MEESIIEARLFETYLDTLKRANIIFVIAGRGTREYKIPTYHDFCVYKYRNLLQSALMARRQMDQIREAELMLPPGITPYQIEDLTKRLLAALEDKSSTKASV